CSAGSATFCCPCRTPTRGRGRCWTWKGSRSGCRPGPSATRRWSGRSPRAACTTSGEPTVTPSIDLEELGLDRGGHLLLARALAALAPGQRLEVRGRHPALRVQLG